MNRTRQITVNAHQSRTHESWWQVGEKGALSADFNGALETGRTIASVSWTSCGPVSLSAPATSGDVIQTTVEAIASGWAEIKATVTLDNGEKRVQRFVVRVV